MSSGSLLVFLLLTGTASAQINVGRFSGTILDATGAAIQEAEVTITQNSTHLAWHATTDNAGFYVVTNLPVGAYTVRVEAAGFRPAEKTGYDLADDGRLTANFTLQLGTITASIEVAEVAGETVNTVSGEISRVIGSEQVEDLALNGRNYMQLVTLIPGVVVTSLDQMATTTSLSVSNQSINGSRTDSNHLMVDGGMNLDSGSNGSQNNNVGVDFIAEVKIQTSAFSAQFGRNSGASINVVTKSGGMSYHGSFFETIRNDFLDARDFFAPVKPKLRFNDFGWTLSGPVAVGPLKKGKVFFFAGEEWKKIRRFTNPSRQTLPTLAELKGDFSGRTTNIRYPGTQTPIPNKDLSSLMTADGRAIMAVYAAMIQRAGVYRNAATTNNAIYQVLNPFNYREDIARLDWHASDKHSLYLRYVHDNYNTIDPFGSFTASSLPTTPTARNRPGYGPQLGHIWTVSAHLINEAKINSSWNGQRTPLLGDAWQRSVYGFQFPRVYGGNGEYSTGIPDVTVQNFASFNGPARVYLISPVTDISISDSVTYLAGAHTIKAGANYIRNRKDQNGRTTYDGSVAFNTGSPNNNTTGMALADAALGNFQTYTEAGSDPLGFFRFTQVDAYVEDTWRVSRRLSVTAGARFSYFTPIYTVANNISNFVPALYDPAQAVTVTPGGLIVPGSGNRYNGIIRAGNGVPPDQLGRVPGADSDLARSIPTGAPRGLYNPQYLLMPRFSFAWTPLNTSKFAVRGGFGTFHDRTQGNLIFSQENQPPYSYSVQYQSGNLANPSGAAVPQPAPFSTRGIDPHLKVPVVYSFNLGIEAELPRGFFLTADYQGRQERHQLWGPNINEPSFAALVANQALPSSGRPVTNSFVPYKGYATITEFLSDATGNYNGLQMYLTKRKGDLNLTLSYTWSKMLDEADSYSDAADAVEHTTRRFNYGPADRDRRQVLVSTYTYRIPLMRHSHGFTRAAFAGWELSGIIRLQSGAYLTPTGTSSIPGSRRSEYLGGPVALPSGERGPDHWFNTSAFSNAPATALGNAGVGIIQGPGWENIDLSARKVFRVREAWTLRFTADSFNTLNHANFNNPNVTTSSTSFGTISSSQPARNIQFGLRLAF